MDRQENLKQIARMEERLRKFPDFSYLSPTAKYVGLKNDGEVELEQLGQAEANEEEFYER